MVDAARLPSLEGDRALIPADALEHVGFRRWVVSEAFPDNARATFAEGEVFFQMSPESIEAHNKVKKAFTTDLEQLVREEDLGEVYADGALLTHEEAALSTEPDAMFANWDTLESGRLAFVAGVADTVELVGTPDIVLEVVSPSSVRKDTVALRAAYARARVPEYWLVDARGQEVRLEVLRLESGAYAASAAGYLPQPSLVFGRSFTLERERNRIGRWTYRLRY